VSDEHEWDDFHARCRRCGATLDMIRTGEALTRCEPLGFGPAITYAKTGYVFALDAYSATGEAERILHGEA
jgi:ribosomal protein L37E